MQARLERARFVKEFELRGVIPNLHAKVELSNDRISKEILEGLVIQPEGLSLEPEITLAGEVSLVRSAFRPTRPCYTPSVGPHVEVSLSRP